MTYAEAIKELWRRSGLGVEQYAAHVRYSKTHISNVLNDKQPGTLKMLLLCLSAEGIDVQECICLPSDPANSSEDDNALQVITTAIAKGGEERERVIECADTLSRRAGRTRRTAKVRDGPARAGPAKAEKVFQPGKRKGA